MTVLPALLASVLAVTPTPGVSQRHLPSTPAPPGAPGVDQQYLPADKSGFITSKSGVSTVWATVQKEGGLGEIFYPTIDSPSARALEFVVADRHGHAFRAGDAATVRTDLTDDHSLSYRQTFTARDGRWRLTADYVTDPARPTVLVDLDLRSRGGRYDLYAVYDPALANSRGGDAGHTENGTLVATDGAVTSAFAARPAFTATSNGYAGVSDGLTDLLSDGRMDWHYATAPPGNLIQTAALRPRTTLALSFSTSPTPTAGNATEHAPAVATAVQRRDPGNATNPTAAIPLRRGLGMNAVSAATATLRRDPGAVSGSTATLRDGPDVVSGPTATLRDGPEAVSGSAASLRRGFRETARLYAYGWRHYLGGLRQPPGVVGNGASRRLYLVSTMVLAASEDKTHPGAYVAAPASPWAFGRDDPSGPYHLVWSRDLYQIATALLAAGDRAGAARALDFLFGTQQKTDGSFPQNSRVDGTPVWGGLQLDEVALPIVLAYQLGRTDAATWDHVRRAAEFLLGGERAPWTPQERWENQSGYSPGTIAAEIAGLVCAAAIARANGDPDAERRYLATADDWRSRVKSWTVTSTGPYPPGRYFLRLTKDGNPDAGTTYAVGDSGPSHVDQRSVVDPSFLELVRLGILPAGDPDVRSTLTVVDAQLGVRTPHGFFWHRASFDGYGEKLDGSPWDYGLPDDSLITRGRAWPLLNGERGEYATAAGDAAEARTQLRTMAAAAGPGDMLPEQVWDQNPPAVAPGTPTTSATPLAWTHAQFIRLAWSVQAGRVVEQPAAVADRYL